MDSSNSNRSLSLAGVVAVEAWYEKFSADCADTDFFLHVRFQDGVFGSKPEDPVRFKIRLKNASISIVPEDPIKIPRKHVRRDRIEVEAKRVTERNVAASGHIEANANGKVSGKGASGEVSLDAGARVEAAGSDKVLITKVSHSGMTIEHSTDESGYNSWSFAPVDGPHLYGQAFNETDPLLKMTHENEVSKIPPVVKVQVTCLREDIDIVDLAVKEPNKWKLGRGMGEAQKLKLAEEMIKSALMEGGLPFEGELDKVSRVSVADVIAAEE